MKKMLHALPWYRKLANFFFFPSQAHKGPVVMEQSTSSLLRDIMGSDEKNDWHLLDE